jgi:DNA repair protein RecO (recombination protein O)
VPSGRLLQTEALVISSMRYQEADRILTLYTKERGRLSAIARGVRRTRSKMGGRLEPFSLVRVDLYAGRSLYTVTGVETVRTFRGMREALFRMEEGGRLLEAVRRLFPGEERHVAAFNLLVRALARLASTESAEEARGVVLAARVKLLLALGYLPELDSCMECGGGEYLCGFNPSLGGVLCRDCYGEEAHDCFSLSPVALSALRELLELPVGEAAERLLDAGTITEVERVIARTLEHHG